MRKASQARMVCDECGAVMGMGPLNFFLRQPPFLVDNAELDESLRFHYDQTGHFRYVKQETLVLVEGDDSVH